jgi:hypothetical protein
MVDRATWETSSLPEQGRTHTIAIGSFTGRPGIETEILAVMIRGLERAENLPALAVFLPVPGRRNSEYLAISTSIAP